MTRSYTNTYLCPYLYMRIHVSDTFIITLAMSSTYGQCVTDQFSIIVDPTILTFKIFSFENLIVYQNLYF
jgi:hypothetical protein